MPRQVCTKSFIFCDFAFVCFVGFLTSGVRSQRHVFDDQAAALRRLQDACAGIADWSSVPPAAACHVLRTLEADAEAWQRRLEDSDPLDIGHTIELGSMSLPKWVVIMIFLVCVGLFAFCWEAAWLQSTLVNPAVKQRLHAAEKNFLDSAEHVARKASMLVHKHADHTGGNSSRMTASWSFDDSRKYEFDVAQANKFWQDLELSVQSKRRRESQYKRANDVSLLGFRKRVFHAASEAHSVSICVQRRGPCDSRVQVEVQTRESSYSSTTFSAISGKDFDPVHQVLTFESGVRTVSFEVLLRPEKLRSWRATRWFHVCLVKGSVCPEGAAELDAGRLNSARVFISDYGATRFPFNIPDKRAGSTFWLMAYYMADRYSVRGYRFRKTIYALCYEPFHNVVVAPVAQVIIIDHVVFLKGDGSFWLVVFLSLVQLISVAILRWSDSVQTKNRGSGGIRQQHRSQLFAKLLMLGHEEQWQIVGSRWFYAAIQSVDAVVEDGYWQSLMLIQKLFALFLSLMTLLFFGFFTITPHGIERSGSLRYIPFLLTLFIVPVSLSWIVKRERTLGTLVEQRCEAEDACTETFSWLAHSGRELYSFGPMELANVETLFDQQGKLFLARHQAARDVLTDSRWITQWLGAAGYCMVLVWGGFSLVMGQRGHPDGMTAGDYIVILKMVTLMGSYLGKINQSVCLLQRAKVYLEQVSTLLNLPEKQHLSRVQDGEASVGLQPEDEDAMVFVNVEFELAQTQVNGVGPFAPLKTKGKIELPLFRCVRIVGGTESTRMTFLALVARVLHPSRGEIYCPPHAWAVLLPSTPPQPLGNITVEEELSFVTPTAHSSVAARNLARALDLDPSLPVVRLPPGQAQLLALARALLRDPEVLVLARSLAFVTTEQGQRVSSLLRMWQAEGAPGLMRRLLPEPDADLTQPGSGRATHLRTLVVMDEDLPFPWAEDESVLPDATIDIESYIVHNSNEWPCLFQRGSRREGSQVSPPITRDL